MTRPAPVLALDSLVHVRPLGAFGVPAYQSHAQLQALLNARKRADLAAYFSTPLHDPERGEIRWVAPMAGEARRWSQLDPDARARARERLQAVHQGLLEQISQLSSAPATGPGGGRAFAELLGHAMQVPATGEHLHFMADQPVIDFWGFADARGLSVDPALQCLSGRDTPPEPAPPAPAVLPTPPAPLPPPASQAPARPWRWRRALLALAAGLGLLALLLAFGSLGRCSDRPAPAAEPTPPRTEGRKAEQALDIPPGALERGDLSFLEGDWQLGDDRLIQYWDTPDQVTGSGRRVLSFGRDGTGRAHFVERRQHGRGQTDGPAYPPCSGSMRASTDGRVLVIDQGPCEVADNKGSGTGPSRQECRRTETGRTLCESVNQSDGRRWQAHLNRLTDAR